MKVAMHSMATPICVLAVWSLFYLPHCFAEESTDSCNDKFATGGLLSLSTATNLLARRMDFEAEQCELLGHEYYRQ